LLYYSTQGKAAGSACSANWRRQHSKTDGDAEIAAPRLIAMAPHFAEATRGERKDDRRFFAKLPLLFYYNLTKVMHIL